MRIRLTAWLLIAVLLGTSASAEFGTGPIAFNEHIVPQIDAAPEPTIGIPWTTDHVFYHSGITTMRYSPEASPEERWVDVTPPYQVPTNLDPMLVAHEETGRILAGGLLGACSVMMLSDDDGETWIPSANMCSGAQFDHQAVGLGIKPMLGNPLGTAHALNGYYCGQLALIGCAVSLDGGETWTAPSPAALVSCGGFHGHWRVSSVTGSAFLPVPACGSQHGMLVPTVATVVGGGTGLLFSEKLVEGSHEWTGGFDPSIGLSRDAGYLYYGMADHMGARMALSLDEGDSWEAIGPDADTTWLDVGQFHDPPVVAATFADVQAGDDDRVAFTFIGLEDLDGDGLGDEYPDLYSCEVEDENGATLDENREWHYYAAFSYDRGTNWTVHKITDHPVQIGGVWDGGGGNPCRNLLDFNDMDINSQGRVYIAWADGCLGDCLAADEDGRYSRAPRLFEQTGGRGLFAAYDGVPTVIDSDGDGIPDSEDPSPDGEAPGGEDNGIPALGPLAAIGLLGAAFARRR